ncbi:MULTISPECIES: CBS domain-containing protein [unclassified Rhodococcus (in: high G+C Gram-positive bacteria)]|uniref:CBS domain-containing protein n=1 Tax=unclassified Rhodococcus (in: high G+C Gram-positive bacteria) TaxID=192944 RepID=UPI00030A0E8E|nr:CBS domain-containing protein [Rhodococcus sp. DK17]
MHARHIMSSPVTTVTPSTPVDECLRILASSGFTVLPVVDESHHLAGIVSEGDLLRAKFHTLPRPDLPAAETMTTPVVTMTPDTDVSDLASAMLRAGLRGIPIVHEHDVIGIVTRRDLLALLTVDDTLIAKEVQHRLDVYAGSRRWTVQITDGKVTITGLALDDPEREVVTGLAETVPGVADVQFTLS